MDEYTNDINKKKLKLVEYSSENYKPNNFYFRFRGNCEKFMNNSITIICFPCIACCWIYNSDKNK